VREDAGHDTPVWRAADSAARESYGKLLALLVARSGDVASAEDALADAFAAALTRWPKTGVPQSPEAWLLTTARNRLIDSERHRRTGELVGVELARQLEPAAQWLDDVSEFPDYRLGLMLACTHPAIDAAARTPLILQAVLGFDAARIAAAFVQSPAAVAQRLVRAKRKIRDAGIAMQVAPDVVPPERLEAVLDAIYVAYADGWADPMDANGEGRGLVEEAMRLSRVVVALTDGEPEPLGLLALMLYAESRRTTRRRPDGDYVPLNDQNPSAWDGALIDEAERLLARAGRAERIGRFQLEAAIQSVHAARRRTGGTDWGAIVQLYDELLSRTGSVVVATNRAVALAAVHGPEAGLLALESLRADPRIETYQPYWAARADLCAQLGDRPGAHDAYQRAIGLVTDPSIRRFLLQRSVRDV
jgi:RNA polymerase sigma-70 factor (ECF subfamily)